MQHFRPLSLGFDATPSRADRYRARSMTVAVGGAATSSNSGANDLAQEAIEDREHVGVGRDGQHLELQTLDALAERGLSTPIPVHLGEQTLDEMCLGVFGVLAPAGLLDQLEN